MGVEYGQVNKYVKYGQPSLDLVFTGAKKSLTDRVSNVAVGFARTQNTPSSYVKSDGIIGYAATDVPRFDHDPVTGESLGLLVEESRTNYIADNSTITGWSTTSGTSAVSASTTVCPDGSTDGIRITGSVANDGVSKSFTAISATYIGSCYARSRTGSSQNVKIAFSGVTGITQTLPASGDWVRIKGNPGVSLGAGSRYLSVRAVSNGTLDIDVWGEQAEVGTFPTSYIPTSGSISTRGADTATISGVNYSNNFDPHPTGTVYCEYNREYDESTNSSTRRPWTFSRGTTNNNVQIKCDGSGNEGFYLVDGGTTSIVGVTTVVSEGVFRKTACAWDNTTMSASFGNVGIATTTMNSSLPFNSSIDEFSIGSYPSYSNTYLMGHVKRLTYWSRRLPDSDLQSLTE